MNIFIILSVVVGVALAQQGDIKDCEPRQSAVSVRDVQDIYQRPISYDSVDYSPHSTYGPPDPVRPTPHYEYSRDINEGANNPRPAYAPLPKYNDIRQQFPYAPVYGPAPPRARVAAAAGIFDDYEDLQYTQPPAPPLPPVIRRYNINYAQREPYQSGYRYEAYPSRLHPFHVPVYYAPLPEGYYPIRAQSSTPTTTTTTTTTEEPKVNPSTEPRTNPAPLALPNTQYLDQSAVYEDTQPKRQPPTVDSSSSEEDNGLHQHFKQKFKKPFLGIANLFRGSVISARNKIGVIPAIVQGSVNKFT